MEGGAFAEAVRQTRRLCLSWSSCLGLDRWRKRSCSRVCGRRTVDAENSISRGFERQSHVDVAFLGGLNRPRFSAAPIRVEPPQVLCRSYTGCGSRLRAA